MILKPNKKYEKQKKNVYLCKRPVSLVCTQAAADLSGMDGSRELSVSKVVHKAFIDVNEEGSEAAAATAVIARARSLPKVMRFFADRPFIFCLRDNEAQALLFVGRLGRPEN